MYGNVLSSHFLPYCSTVPQIGTYSNTSLLATSGCPIIIGHMHILHLNQWLLYIVAALNNARGVAWLLLLCQTSGPALGSCLISAPRSFQWLQVSRSSSKHNSMSHDCKNRHTPCITLVQPQLCIVAIDLNGRMCIWPILEALTVLFPSQWTNLSILSTSLRTLYELYQPFNSILHGFWISFFLGEMVLHLSRNPEN